MSNTQTHAQEINGDSGFTVGQRIASTGAVEFGLWLPHSCDEWTIAEHVDRATAIAEAERFVAEAQAALDYLRTSPDIVIETHDFNPTPAPPAPGLRCATAWADGKPCGSYSYDHEVISNTMGPKDRTCRRVVMPEGDTRG